VASGLADDQEVLIVTLVNAAVDNFRSRIAGFIKRGGLLPGFGYGCALCMAWPTTSCACAPAWSAWPTTSSSWTSVRQITSWKRSLPLAARPINALDGYLAWGELSDDKPTGSDATSGRLALDLARAFVNGPRLDLTPAMPWPSAWRGGNRRPGPLQLAAMAPPVYRDYHIALTYRGGVHFDDLIRLAYEALVATQIFWRGCAISGPSSWKTRPRQQQAAGRHSTACLAGHPEGNWCAAATPNQAVYPPSPMPAHNTCSIPARGGSRRPRGA